jgi:hypothetical protein
MNVGRGRASKFDVEKSPILALPKCHTMPSRTQRNSLKTNETHTPYSTHKTMPGGAQKHGHR